MTRFLKVVSLINCSLTRVKATVLINARRVSFLGFLDFLCLGEKVSMSNDLRRLLKHFMFDRLSKASSKLRNSVFAGGILSNVLGELIQSSEILLHNFSRTLNC